MIVCDIQRLYGDCGDATRPAFSLPKHTFLSTHFFTTTLSFVLRNLVLLSVVALCLVWARFVCIFTQIKVMEINKFWQVFTVVFFFIVWAGALFNIKPFVALWKVMRWFLIIIFTVLLAGYAKDTIKQWWND